MGGEGVWGFFCLGLLVYGLGLRVQGLGVLEISVPGWGLKSRGEMEVSCFLGRVYERLRVVEP